MSSSHTTPENNSAVAIEFGSAMPQNVDRNTIYFIKSENSENYTVYLGNTSVGVTSNSVDNLSIMLYLQYLSTGLGQIEFPLSTSQLYVLMTSQIMQPESDVNTRVPDIKLFVQSGASTDHYPDANGSIYQLVYSDTSDISNFYAVWANYTPSESYSDSENIQTGDNRSALPHAVGLGNKIVYDSNSGTNRMGYMYESKLPQSICSGIHEDFNIRLNSDSSASFTTIQSGYVSKIGPRIQAILDLGGRVTLSFDHTVESNSSTYTQVVYANLASSFFDAMTMYTYIFEATIDSMYNQSASSENTLLSENRIQITVKYDGTATWRYIQPDSIYIPADRRPFAFSFNTEVPETRNNDTLYFVLDETEGKGYEMYLGEYRIGYAEGDIGDLNVTLDVTLDESEEIFKIKFPCSHNIIFGFLDNLLNEPINGVVLGTSNVKLRLSKDSRKYIYHLTSYDALDNIAIWSASTFSNTGILTSTGSKYQPLYNNDMCISQDIMLHQGDTVIDNAKGQLIDNTISKDILNARSIIFDVLLQSDYTVKYNNSLAMSVNTECLNSFISVGADVKLKFSLARSRDLSLSATTETAESHLANYIFDIGDYHVFEASIDPNRIGGFSSVVKNAGNFPKKLQIYLPASSTLTYGYVRFSDYKVSSRFTHLAAYEDYTSGVLTDFNLSDYGHLDPDFILNYIDTTSLFAPIVPSTNPSSDVNLSISDFTYDLISNEYRFTAELFGDVLLNYRGDISTSVTSGTKVQTSLDSKEYALSVPDGNICGVVVDIDVATSARTCYITNATNARLLANTVLSSTNSGRLKRIICMFDPSDILFRLGKRIYPSTVSYRINNIIADLTQFNITLNMHDPNTLYVAPSLDSSYYDTSTLTILNSSNVLKLAGAGNCPIFVNQLEDNLQIAKHFTRIEGVTALSKPTIKYHSDEFQSIRYYSNLQFVSTYDTSGSYSISETGELQFLKDTEFNNCAFVLNAGSAATAKIYASTNRCLVFRLCNFIVSYSATGSYTVRFNIGNNHSDRYVLDGCMFQITRSGTTYLAPTSFYFYSCYLTNCDWRSYASNMSLSKWFFYNSQINGCKLTAGTCFGQVSFQATEINALDYQDNVFHPASANMEIYLSNGASLNNSYLPNANVFRSEITIKNSTIFSIVNATTTQATQLNYIYLTNVSIIAGINIVHANKTSLVISMVGVKIGGTVNPAPMFKISINPDSGVLYVYGDYAWISSNKGEVSLTAKTVTKQLYGYSSLSTLLS